jgi:PadR family transcriptional regulator, regulatory protein PadR
MTLYSSRAAARTDLLRGTLDMLILRTLQWGRSTAMPSARRFGHSPPTCFRSKQARCTGRSSGWAKKGWITSKWGQTPANQRAKFYRITPEGKKQLLREESRWTELVNAIGRVMKPATDSKE